MLSKPVRKSGGECQSQALCAGDAEPQEEVAGCAPGAGELLESLGCEELTELSDSEHSSGKGWNLCGAHGRVKQCGAFLAGANPG